jgi:hypothetical protein
MLFSFSTAVEASLREEDCRRPTASAFGVAASADEEDARLGVKEVPVPGCLNMPKLLEIRQKRFLRSQARGMLFLHGLLVRLDAP